MTSYGYDPGTGLGLKLAKFDISGEQLLKGLEVGVGYGGDLFLEVSGVRFAFDSTAPRGHQIDPTTLRIGDQPWDARQMYSATVNEASANMLGQFGVSVSNLEFLDDFEYEVLRDYVSCSSRLLPIQRARVLDSSGCASEE